jgi:hypothetical protein
VVQVPWARHHAGHTLAFDDQVAWLAVHTSKTAVGQLMRIAWRTVGAICARVAADAEARVDRHAVASKVGEGVRGPLCRSGGGGRPELVDQPAEHRLGLGPPQAADAGVGQAPSASSTSSGLCGARLPRCWF